ncbi:RHS repeat protein [Phyllobacterium bourgognense]|uniref:Type VI secretion system effector TseH-like domain-containing protein n=1 Tax=Phyllobacterium bourgognense TaxID=314236 RepID=A0A368Z6W9_9HYPH|nr:RHS repeat protein [Phyllobacterium bourgognense]RCW87709.1 hypothetical protein C7476_101477 [Phyllobacterium bourgognense]
MVKQIPIFIPVILPNYNVGSGGNLEAPMLGHAAFIVIDENGKATYQEFGRYDPKKVQGVVTNNQNEYTEGNIRQHAIVAKLEFDDAGNLTERSLTAALDEVFDTSGLYKNTDIGAAQITQFKMSKEQTTQINTWFGEQKKLINDGITHYSIFDRNCMKFVYDAANAAGLKISNAQNLTGLSIPSIGGANILEVAKKGYEYYAPNSWNKIQLTALSGPGSQTASFFIDRAWQATKAMAEWVGVDLAVDQKDFSIITNSITGLPTAIEFKNTLGRLLQRTSIEKDGTLKNVTFDDLSTKTREALLNPNGSLITVSTFNPAGLKTSEKQFNLDGSRNETSFDPVSGEATYKTLFKADGTATQTTYDIVNVKSWKEATAEYGKDGKLVSEKVINDNNTRIDRVFFPGTTKTNFSKEYDAAGKLTTETTYRVDGTQTRKLHDVENKGDWREATIDYDKNGNRILEKAVNDDGSRYDLIYDSNDVPKSKTVYNPAGKVTTVTTNNSDGTQTETVYDPDNKQSWREATVQYGRDGNPVSEKGINDDGSKYDATYQPGTSKVNSYVLTRGDGTQSKTVFDADNQQDWRDGTFEYDKNGKLISEQGTFDDGTTYDQKYDPLTGKMTARTDYNPTGNVTSIRSVKTDGSETKTVFDPENKEAWKEATIEYRKDGSLVSEKGLNDNGTRYDLTFDKDTGEVNRRFDYNQAGQKVSDTVFKIDGTQTKTVFDPDNQQDWREDTFEYDKNGKLISEKGTFDDGEKYDQKYDPLTGKMTSRTDYNPAGNVTSIRSVRADGAETKTVFDPDNKQTWKEATIEYRKDGSLISEKGLNDNGTRYDLTFDKDTGEVNRRQEYNQAGQTTSTTTFKVDGTQSRLFYDVGNKQGWREATVEFDKNGRLVSEKGVIDDGTRYDVKYDPNTNKMTARTDYNLGGQVSSATSVNADGSRTRTFYDPANAAGWKEVAVRYDKNGKAIWEKGTIDDGSRYDVAYDSTTGKVTARTDYNPAGQVTSITAVHADGSQTVTMYDPENKSNLQKAVIEYDKYGDPVSEIGTLDDGTRYESTYDFRGVKTEKVIYPDGTASEKEFMGGKIWKYTEQDLGNHQGWAQIEETYYSDGKKWSEERIMDNGDIYQFGYDMKTGEATSASWTHNGVKRFGELNKKKNSFVFKTGGGGGDGGGFWSQVFDFVSSIVRPWSSWSSTIGGDSSSNPKSRPPVFDITKHLDDCPYYNNPHPSNHTEDPDGTIHLNTIVIYGSHPVLLDLNNDNTLDVRLLERMDLADISTPRFDWNSDGTPDRTAWVGPDDGLLVIDLAKDGAAGPDGKIDQAREIAFALWKTEKEIDSENVTDLEGLRYAFDTNHDNMLDQNDARWNEFRVWQDTNQNGISEDGELMTMSDAGIKLINLLPDPKGAKQFADGSAITGTTTALMTDGTTMLVGDVSLRFQPFGHSHHMV